jgi:hypothetical protein
MDNTEDKITKPMPMPLPENHICFEMGHAMYEQFVFHNHKSSWGSHKCSRCGYDESWQYDFPYSNPMHKD